MQILFSKIAAVTLEDGAPVLENAYVLVDGTKITYVGTEEPPHDADCEIIDGSGRALLPGFINAHTHLPMTALRGYADGIPLDRWLNEFIFPAEDRLDARAVRAATDLALAEMCSSGSVSASDMYMFCGEIADCAVRAGMKLNVARGLVIQSENPEEIRRSQGWREQEELLRDWQGAGDGLIRVDASIHGEYTSTPQLWDAVRDFAMANGLRIQLHLSETYAEHHGCKERRWMTPAMALMATGVFDCPVTAAHGVFLEKDDITALKFKRGFVLAHCPVSNLKLGSGIAPMRRLLENGVTVALGTDGASSNDSHDMFEEIKLAAMLHRGVEQDAELVTPVQALKMATEGGAAAQGRGDECGKLAAGYDADLTVLDLSRPGLHPQHSLVSNIVYCARGSDVYMTLCRGRTLYRAGEWKTIDVERAIYEVDRYAAPLVSGRL